MKAVKITLVVLMLALILTPFAWADADVLANQGGSLSGVNFSGGARTTGSTAEKPYDASKPASGQAPRATDGWLGDGNGSPLSKATGN